MAWDSGNILFSSNFEMRVGKPLDAKQVVTDNLDLNSITFPYDGLIVHVTSTDETYVCIAKDDVPGGVSGGGAIDAAVWKNVGGGAADVVVLPDQSPAPSGIADKSQLVSLDDTTAESRPDFLYRFDEGVDVATATDDGRLQVNGTKYNSGGSAYNVTGSAPWGNRAKFNHLALSKISVGAAGAAAPFYFTSDTGDRGDFEIQFRFVLDADDEVYCLMSTDATDATTEGFYAVLVDTDTGVNDSSIIFRSMHSIDSVVAQFEAEWTIPGDVNWLTAHHLAISFMEDDRSIAGNANGGGKLRCYFDGVVLEDDKTEGAYSIVAPEFNNIGRKPSTSTIWPVNLGQYLDGSGGSSVYYLDGDMDEFAVYNHRCLHNTSDKFTPPAAPTRAAALSVPNVVDSEGTASPIITASNAGMLLPKSVEGLADGSLWNDKGAVRIAPLTGDLDAADAAGEALADAVDSADGVLSLPMGAAPAAEIGFAKIYSKSSLIDAAAERLYHFPEDTSNSAGIAGAAATVGGASLPATQYVTPTDLGYTNGSDVWVSTLASGGFGKSFHVAGTSGTGTPMNHLEVPNPEFGNGEITIEFFVQFLTDDRNQTLFAWMDGLNNGVGLYTNYHWPYGSSDPRKLSLWNNDAGTVHYCNWDIEWDSDLTKSKHYAVQRTANSGGYAQWDLYIDGNKIAHAGTHGSPYGNLQTVNVAGDDHFQIGSWPPSQTSQANFYLDELRMSKLLVYSGSTYTVPVEQHGTPTAKLYGMDGLGNETQLTP